MSGGFGMGPSLGFSLSQRQTQRLEQRLSQAQRQEIRLAQLDLTRELISALSNTQYDNNTSCPQCGHRLTLLEVVQGWRNDPTDITTKCPHCKHRFFAKMRRPITAGYAELTLYCPTQTLARLPRFTHLTPELFEREDAGVFFSAKFHWGSITQAMTEAGLDYLFPEMIKWEDKVEPFLGKMPDVLIAKHCNQPVARIRALRVKKGIKAYRMRASLE